MQKAIRLVTRFLAKCQKDKINAYSAQIAFFIILSIIPFLMVFSSMLQYTSITEDMVFEIIERVMPQYVAPFLVTLVKEIYTRSMGIISVTAIIAIWSAAKGIQYMADGLNAVHELKETRNWFVLRFWAVIYTIVFLVAIVFTLVVLVFGNSLRNLAADYLRIQSLPLKASFLEPRHVQLHGMFFPSGFPFMLIILMDFPCMEA